MAKPIQQQKPKQKQEEEDNAAEPEASQSQNGKQRRGPASMRDFDDKHFRRLNKAATLVLLRHQNELFDLDVALEPWKPKGRMADLTRQLMRSAKEGEAAAAELKKEREAEEKREGKGKSQGGGGVKRQAPEGDADVKPTKKQAVKKAVRNAKVEYTSSDEDDDE